MIRGKASTFLSIFGIPETFAFLVFASFHFPASGFKMFSNSQKCLKKLTLFLEFRTEFKHFGELKNASNCFKSQKCLKLIECVWKHGRPCGWKLNPLMYLGHHSPFVSAEGGLGLHTGASYEKQEEVVEVWPILHTARGSIAVHRRAALLREK